MEDNCNTKIGFFIGEEYVPRMYTGTLGRNCILILFIYK